MRTIGGFIDRNDFFSTPIPTFNVAGSDSVGSPLGCLLTLLCATCMLLYSGYKGILCFAQMNPNLSSIEIEDMYSVSEHRVDMNEVGFNIAFMVRKKNIPRDDPSFIDFETQLIERDDTGKVASKVDIESHRCSETELESMYPCHENQASVFAELKQSKGLRCLDTSNLNTTLFGSR